MTKKLALFGNTSKGFVHSPEKRPSSASMMLWFGEGAKKHGWEVDIVTDNEERPNVDMCVIFGYGRKTLGDLPPKARQVQRRRIVEDYLDRKVKTVCMDSPLLNGAKAGKFVRVGLNSPLGNGDFAYQTKLPNREKFVYDAAGLCLHPYRNKGEYLILTLQPQNNWSMAGRDIVPWANQKIQEIRKYTTLPIHVRAHPGKPEDLQRIIGADKLVNAKNWAYPDHLSKAHAVVTFNTTAGVDALQFGVPVWAEESESHVWKMAHTDISMIEKPILSDRTEWFQETIHKIWTKDEIESGKVFDRLYTYLRKKAWLK